jgi:hypothetical protein
MGRNEELNEVCFRRPVLVGSKSNMRNLKATPIALLVSGAILLMIGVKTGGSMGRVESIGGEVFMLVGLAWVAIVKFRG